MTVTRYSSGIVVADRDPTVLDDQTDGNNLHTLWRNLSTLRCWLSVDDAEGAADWRELLVMPASVATGDVLYVTSTGALSRLAIGTAGQVLTVNAGATGLEWKTPA